MDNKVKYIIVKEDKEKETTPVSINKSSPINIETATKDIVTKEQTDKPTNLNFSSFNEDGELESSAVFNSDNSDDTFDLDSESAESIISLSSIEVDDKNGGSKNEKIQKEIKTIRLDSDDAKSIKEEKSESEESEESSEDEENEVETISDVSLNTVDILSLDPLYSVLSQLFKGRNGETLGEIMSDISSELKKLNKNFENKK